MATTTGGEINRRAQEAAALIKESPFKLAAAPVPPRSLVDSVAMHNASVGTSQMGPGAMLGGRPTMDNRAGNHPLAAATLMTTDVLENGWRISREKEALGCGSFGLVFKGSLTDENNMTHDVAIKFSQTLTSEIAEKALKTEEEVFRRLPPCENIIKYMGGKSIRRSPEETTYIVLEYMPQNLRTVMEDENSLDTFGSVLRIMKGVAWGMKHLDDYNITHYDLKPENVLLSEDLVPKLTDFGASKIRQRQTMSAAYRGTHHYMAPETKLAGCLRGPKRVNGQSVDVYSFGVMLWECTTGGEVIPSENDSFVVWGGVHPENVQCNCPEELRKLIEDCLKFDMSLMSKGEYDRPTSLQIHDRISCMLNTCDWIDSPLPWKVQ